MAPSNENQVTHQFPELTFKKCGSPNTPAEATSKWFQTVQGLGDKPYDRPMEFPGDQTGGQ